MYPFYPLFYGFKTCSVMCVYVSHQNTQSIYCCFFPFVKFSNPLWSSVKKFAHLCCRVMLNNEFSSSGELFFSTAHQKSQTSCNWTVASPLVIVFRTEWAPSASCSLSWGRCWSTSAPWTDLSCLGEFKNVCRSHMTPVSLLYLVFLVLWVIYFVKLSLTAWLMFVHC